MRAAEAAKNTSSLIEESVRQIKEGAELVDVTNKAFDEVAVQADKVTHLVGEIAAASTEQAQGIDQVNTAVSEMDRVVQQNAATAEESASASEEMNAQAEQMKTMVNELVAYIEGGARPSPSAEAHSESPGRAGKVPARKKPGAQAPASSFQNSQEARSIDAPQVYDDF
jgi:methyl-accepting chemotaxis protein